MQSLSEDIMHAIIEGEAELAKAKTEQAIITGIPPLTIINDALVPAMTHVGKDFKHGYFYIPDVLMSSRAAQAALYVLKPLMGASDPTKKKALVVVGTVAGDLHDIGKNITKLILESDGFEVIDLGIDVISSEFINAVKEHKPDILCISALLTTTMNEMTRIIEELEASGLRKTTKIFLGGNPVTQDFAESIGADCYCDDAFETLAYANVAVGTEPLLRINY